METRANYVLIGAFVLIAAAALMLFVVWIAKAPFSRNLDVYDVVFDGPVNGLGKGGEVRFNGIKVGEVSRLSLDRKDPNKVIARISVDAQTPVRVDSKAQLNFLGITGVTFIQILAGSPEKPMLQRTDPNVPAVILAEKTGLDQLLGGGQDILTNVSSALSPDNIAALTGQATAAGLIGRRWQDLLGSTLADSDGGLIERFAKPTTWSGHGVLWRTDSPGEAAPVGELR